MSNEPAYPPSYNVRLRGRWPTIEAENSNMALAMDLLGTGADCTLRVFRGSNAALVMDAMADGTCIAGTDSLLSNLSAPEPYLSFRTARDRERLRVDSNGVMIPTLTADVFTNLVDCQFTSNYSIFRPPTANALTTAYLELSNMIVQSAAAEAGFSNFGAPGELLDTFRSPSVLNAPTANALRSAYYNLSNLIAYRLPPPPTSGSNGSGSNGSGSNGLQFQLANDVWLRSVDQQPRLRFDFDGQTVFAASTSPASTAVTSPVASSFRWFQNDMQQDLMVLSTDGSLQVRSNLAVVGDVVMGPDSGVRFSCLGSNVGLNLPDGVPPECTLHVNGAIYSTEQVYALSDRTSKRDVRMVRGALKRLAGIRACTYRLDAPGTLALRQLGVIAQDVSKVMPEAVRTAPSDGRLSVAYASLVALSIAGINELRREVRRSRRRVRVRGLKA
jgi:hypothetical protein